MSKSKLLVLFSVSLLIFCSCEEDDTFLTKGEQNAQLIAGILEDNPIQFVDIYEFDRTESDWNLAADNQQATEGTNRFSLDGTYFVLDGTGSKSYSSLDTPTHQSIGFYYFDLEYLVSFDISPNRDELFLYFMYQN